MKLHSISRIISWVRICECAASIFLVTYSDISRAGDVVKKRDIFSFIDRFIADPPVNHMNVESILQEKLIEQSSDIFVKYIANNINFSDINVESIDYREPSSQGGSKRGPILVLKLSGKCTEISSIISRYDNLSVSQIPMGRSENEQTYYARQEPWGTLSFGFPAKSPDCLRTVVFSVRGSSGDSI